MVPIGAYSPRWMMSRVHCCPEDSVELHKDILSRKSIGMHWGTWTLTDELITEPPVRMRAAARKRGVKDDEFVVCDIGETLRVPVKA